MAASDNIEKRVFGTQFRQDLVAPAEGTGRTVEGYAAVFSSPTTIDWFTEVIEPGAFDEALSRSDCRALFNHKDSYLLARQSSGTLSLSIDERGLRYTFESPNTTVGNDILEMITRGDLKESSFAFTVAEQEWAEEKDEAGNWTYTRKIKKIDRLYDVSPVTYPAYADTSVAARSLKAWAEDQTKKPSPPSNAVPINHIDFLKLL
jgi:HK97 family phage prohead protease